MGNSNQKITNVYVSKDGNSTLTVSGRVDGKHPVGCWKFLAKGEETRAMVATTNFSKGEYVLMFHPTQWIIRSFLVNVIKGLKLFGRNVNIPSFERTVTFGNPDDFAILYDLPDCLIPSNIGFVCHEQASDDLILPNDVPMIIPVNYRVVPDDDLGIIPMTVPDDVLGFVPDDVSGIVPMTVPNDYSEDVSGMIPMTVPDYGIPDGDPQLLEALQIFSDHNPKMDRVSKNRIRKNRIKAKILRIKRINRAKSIADRYDRLRNSD